MKRSFFPRILWAALLVLLAAGPARAWSPTDGVLSVSSVRLEGCQAVSAARLKKMMATRGPKWFFWKTPYQPDVFEKDLQTLTRYYHRRGFLQAEVEDKETDLDKGGRSVRLKAWIYEGPLARVHSVHFEGARALGEKHLLSVLTLRAGSPYDRDLLESSTRALIKAYADEGYLDAQVKAVSAWDKGQTQCDLTWKIQEGPQALLAGFDIQGLGRTRDWVVWREFRTKVGEPLRWDRMEKAQQRLYLTGIFQSLYVKAVPSDPARPEQRVLRADVIENKTREINLSGGWGSVDRFHGQVELDDLDMYGRGRKVSVLASASRILQHLEGNYGTPWTAGVPWFNNINVFGELQEQPGYDLRRVGGVLTVGKNFTPVSKVQFSYHHVNAYLGRVYVTPAPDTDKDFVRSFDVAFILDHRDSFTDPQEGTFFSSSAEMSGSFLHGTDTFIKTVHQARVYHHLTPSTVVGSALEAGWVGNYKSSAPIALTELFYAGGPNALRGFAYQCAGPLDSQGTPIGGQFELILNALEVRQKVWKFIGLAGFWDVGNVFSNIDDFRFGQLRTSGGWGLRLTTRMGVLRADQGFIVSPRPGEKRQRVYISIGQAF